MKTLCLLLVMSLAPGGERERGLLLYREGKYAEAAAAFRAAIEQDGDSPELQWNLALASWRAGELAAAETAAEKYAALGKDARPDLHAGLLGAVRHDEALALAAKAEAAGAAGAPPAGPDEKPVDPLPLLEQALAKATQARDYFVRGATATPTPELLRNTERALRTIDELQKKIDELKKQREQQQKDDKKQDDKQDKKDDKDQKQDDKDQKGDKQDGKDGKDDKQDPKDGKQDGKQDGKNDKQDGKSKDDPANQEGSGQEKPEPKPDAKDGKNQPQPGDAGKPDKPEPKPGADDKEPKPGEQAAGKPGQPRSDAPGEGAEGKELTPEQAQRLLEQLKDLEDRMKASRARAKGGRRPVERDW